MELLITVQKDADDIPYVVIYDGMLQFKASFHSRKRCAKYLEDQMKYDGVKE